MSGERLVYLPDGLDWPDLTDVSCLRFVPYPGSELHDRMVQKKIVDKNNCLAYEASLMEGVYNKIFQMRSYSDHIPAWTLPVFIIGGMSLFYLLQFTFRPWRIFGVARNLSTRNIGGTFESMLFGLYRVLTRGT